LKQRLFVRLDEDLLQGPESGVPPPTLRAFAVLPALRPWVAGVMFYRETFAPGHEVVERVLPDGALRLVVNIADAGVELLLIGPSTTAALVRLGGRMQGLSITLRPGAAPVLFGLPAGALGAAAVRLHELWGAAAHTLAARVHEARDDAARAQAVQEALLARLLHGPDDSPVLAAQAQRLLALPGAKVPAVAAALGVGERRLQQLFHAQVGLPPRQWARLARLHGGLRLLRREPGLPWAALAAEAGYSDQAHLAHEFRALCGITPTDFRLMAASGSYKTAC
jgi:AraC-like DNA-binding protein